MNEPDSIEDALALLRPAGSSLDRDATLWETAWQAGHAAGWREAQGAPRRIWQTSVGLAAVACLAVLLWTDGSPRQEVAPADTAPASNLAAEPWTLDGPLTIRPFGQIAEPTSLGSARSLSDESAPPTQRSLLKELIRTHHAGDDA